MPVYDYTALDGKGKTVTGIIDADGAAAARQKIRAQGKFPVNLREVKSTLIHEGAGKPRMDLSRFFTRVRPAEVSIMTRQLSTLIGAGFPLVAAFDSLMAQITTPALKKIIAGIKASVTEGSSFADALKKYPRVFTPIYINMVASGESSGTLEIVLARLAEIMEKYEALKNRLVTAMIYPLLILMTSVLVVTFMLMYVTPKIMAMFDNMKQALPLPTRILLSISDFMQSYWWVLVLLCIGFLLALRAMRNTPKGRERLDTIILRLPLIGELVRKLAAARFARTLGSLLDNGVSMLPALGIVENIVGNVRIAQAVSNASAEVGKGQGLGKTLGAGETFPPMAIQMIQVGEQSGNLEEMLDKVADVFEKEVENTAMRMSALIEPVMLLIMAVVVLFIVLAICLPIFEMNQMIR